MAEADLETVIRQTAKAQGKALMEAAKKRHGQLMAKAAGAKDKEARARFKLMARSTMEHATATAKRLRNSAENAADSLSRAMKKALEVPAEKPVKAKKG
jgi:actin-like ATPase involved in cell morphogenesis